MNCLRLVLCVPGSAICLIFIFAVLVTESWAASEVRERLPEVSVEQRDADGDGVDDHRDLCGAILPGARDIDSSGCPGAVDPFAELQFDGPLHRGWYDRFWTGTCAGLSGEARTECVFVKIFRSDYWFDTVENVVSRVPTEKRPYLRFQLWRVGRLIGHEWARANDVRHIDTFET